LYVIVSDMNTDKLSTSNNSSSKLHEMHTDQTRRLILETALDILEDGLFEKLTVREVAKRANISERTVFRYYGTRVEFMDAIAIAVRERLDLPPPPSSIEELAEAPSVLFGRFESKSSLTKMALHPELFHRIQHSQGTLRWMGIKKLIKVYAPTCPERQRNLVAANIRFVLSASSWNYYRVYFGFNIDETIEAAELAVGAALKSIQVPSRKKISELKM